MRNNISAEQKDEICEAHIKNNISAGSPSCAKIYHHIGAVKHRHITAICAYIFFFILLSQAVLSAEVQTFINPDNSFDALEDFLNIGARSLKSFLGGAETLQGCSSCANIDIGALSVNENSESGAGGHADSQNNMGAAQTSTRIFSQTSGTNHIFKIATYTFTSYPIAEDLVALKTAGANILILIDAYPVGGIKDKKILCYLEENNIPVFLYQEPYKYMHAKYIVKDDSEILVVTENLGESGFPFNISALQIESTPIGNRGWGAIIEDKKTAEDFLEVFENDIRNSKRFVCNLKDYNISTPTNSEMGAYIQEPSAHIFKNQNVKTFFAPDNALDSILELINSAEEYIYVEQFYIYKYWGSKTKQKSNLFLEALIEKAKEGVEIKILMDSSYYSISESDPKSNYNTMLYVNNIAAAQTLAQKNENNIGEAENNITDRTNLERSDKFINIEARLIDLKALSLGKLHAKVLVSDNRTMISSVNWNENSPLFNRESGVIIEGDSSLFYKQAFLNDWNIGKVSSLSPSGMFIEQTANNNLVIFIFVVSSAGFLAWLKKRK